MLEAPVPGDWNTVRLPSVQVTAGTRYWIALLGPQGTLAFRDPCCTVPGSGPTETSASKTLTTLPTTSVTGTVYDDAPISAYGSA